MDEKVDQPLPADQTASQEGAQPGSQKEKQEPKGMVGKLLRKLQELTGQSQKAKLLLALGTLAVVLFILAILVSLTRRPPRETAAPAQPTLPPRAATPTPRPEEREEKIDTLLEDIEAFEPSQSNLQPPVVDLEIEL
jgi:hypothetical protein